MAGGLDAWRRLIAGGSPLTSVGLDGHCGNSHTLQMARQRHLQLLARLWYEAAWYCPSTGPDAGRGPQRPYGAKVADAPLPMPYLQETTVEGHLQTCVYQAQRRHQACPQPLHGVILAPTNLRPHARA
jgi:hypothetical protein